jgi:hypothetical protein
MMDKSPFLNDWISNLSIFLVLTIEIGVAFFLPPSLPKISYPIEGSVTRTDVAFYFMPGAEQWYKYQSWLLWHPFNLTKLFDSFA